MKLTAAQAKATKGPLKVLGSDNATPHIMSDEGYDIDDRDHLVCAMPAEIARNYNSWPNAALLAHWFNLGPKLLEAFENAAFSAWDDGGYVCAYCRNPEREGHDASCEWGVLIAEANEVKT